MKRQAAALAAALAVVVCAGTVRAQTDYEMDEVVVTGSKSPQTPGNVTQKIEIIGTIAEHRDVAVGIIDVKSYYIETPEDVADRVRLCLRHAPADRLAFAPDCGLSQTARWAARRKLNNMVAGVARVRGELGL